jgi:3-oxoacyl-[acyl-carrier protein] reductase
VLLTGKRIWVTGASRGIGRATALVCAQEGADLILSARSEAGLRDCASEVEHKTGRSALILPFDVADSASMKSAFQQLHRMTKKIDGLVNNAGVLRDALIGMISEEQINEMMRVNLYAPIQILQYVARLMMQTGKGSIVNVASIIGRTGNEGQTAYAASKAGLIGATKSAARELGRHSIRVNAVAPGVIQTDMISKIPEAKMDELKSSIKMGRLGQPIDVANTVAFLLSDMAAYITGQVIGVDGGMWL